MTSQSGQRVAAPPETPRPRRRTITRVLVPALTLLFGVAAVLLTILGAGTPVPTLLIGVAIAAGIAMRRPPRWIVLAAAAACIGVVAYRATLTPSNDRDWETQTSIMPTIALDADTLTIDAVRNFAWRDGETFDASWETRIYTLSNLRGLDMILEPFPYSPLMAHTMLSFDFGPEGRLVLSIEARKQRGERYGAIAGGLNQFELIYLFLDERDALGVRAHQGAELYAFPVRVEPLRLRAFFLNLCSTAQNLRERPRFYRIIRDNCTTAWLQHSDHLAVQPVGLQPDSILNGRIGRLLHERGGMLTDLSYEEAKAGFRVDRRVLELLEEPAFSERIRAR